MIEFRLSEDQVTIRKAAERVAKDIYAPKALEWDRTGEPLPNEERRRLAELGFLGLGLPETYGGGGGELMDSLIVLEELAKECQLAAFQVFEANTGAARVIELFGTEEQKRRLLPPVVAGEKTIAIAISEPDAGSAATDIRTTARLEGSEYVINGTKRWCSGGGHAEQYLVYVRLNNESGARSIGSLIVDRNTPGLTFGARQQYMGFRGIPSADIFFSDARVSVDNLIVGAGGFKRLFNAFSIERLGNATMSLAIGQTCLDRATRYVQERRQFGKELIEFQMVQAALADMIIQVEAARLLIYRAAANAGRGAPRSFEASVAKCFANAMAKAVSNQAMLLHGGYGYAADYGIERFHRDAHGWAIAGGTPDMQRIRIVSEYLNRRFNQRA